MSEIRFTIVPTFSSHGFLDLQAASAISGMHPDMILEFVRARLVVSARRDRGGNPYFDDQGIYRLKQIEQLQREQATARTIRLILDLMTRLDAAESELRTLRERLL